MTKKELENEYYNYLYLQDAYADLIEDIYHYIYFSDFKNSTYYLERLNKKIISFYKYKIEEYEDVD